ncbi:unnamed protein product, partial [Ectocarpus sp. 12 AP-2014]
MALSRCSLATLSILAGPLRTAEALTVEAGTIVGVSVDAPVFDTRSSAPYGCSPVGCLGENTRDGSTSSESRWSCKPSLDPSGSGCGITYTLEEEQRIEELQIALYKGDSRTRAVEIFVDGVMIMVWTSSGETAAFETIELGVQGTVIDLHG